MFRKLLDSIAPSFESGGKFEKFYPAEIYHQDYYQKNLLKYLAYKKACQREEVLEKIWN